MRFLRGLELTSPLAVEGRTAKVLDSVEFKALDKSNMLGVVTGSSYFARRGRNRARSNTPTRRMGSVAVARRVAIHNGGGTTDMRDDPERIFAVPSGGVERLADWEIHPYPSR
jgi:hypothetical protein